MGEPGFWDDASRAAEISAEHAGARSRLGEYEGLRGDLEELTELAELTREAAEEPDPDFIAELDEGLRRADAQLGRLEEARLVSGRHAGGDAVVSIIAGEGGTAYLLATYTAMLGLRDLVARRGFVKPYWEAA